ncbi:rRNA maturation RNase YbeY [Mycoavidus sp. B2-EB]|uniref:rRNA maturation RNase YbeY n=1 Tax=Mycoavidus sp. B2-EB TaxID=2651972 RepID=UPI00162AC1A1|nr:rRNA maturation RNase YbeY [Mycoavidus sp. B2-EB]BBO60167.1 endoribonuclease YbeY [Mycoavidus sp. B2-EB]
MKRAPRLQLTVQFVASNSVSHQALLPRTTLIHWIKTALFADAVLTLRLVDEEEGRMLNRTWRNKDYATNVLTFNYAENLGDPVTADLVLCCPVIEQEASAQKKPLVAHYAHLIVHGVLHAQGYQHDADEEALIMENLETELLNKLGFDNPYC